MDLHYVFQLSVWIHVIKTVSKVMELDFNLLSPQHINYETSFKTKFKVE